MVELIRLDLGCGVHKREGFIGVDSLPLDGVDVVTDLRGRWVWDDNSVDEIHASHFIEHLTATERTHFVNELYRVLKVGGVATIITPHWASCRAYGDPTHQWPPVSEFWFYYLSRSWRLEQGNAPHTDRSHNPQGFACDFDATWGYGVHHEIAARNADFQAFAVNFYKEAITDIHATLTKRG